jgi:hypothetical protein
VIASSSVDSDDTSGGGSGNIRLDFDFLFRPEMYLDAKRPDKAFVHLVGEDLRRRHREICAILADCNNFSVVVERLLVRAFGDGDAQDDGSGAVVMLTQLVIGEFNM